MNVMAGTDTALALAKDAISFSLTEPFVPQLGQAKKLTPPAQSMASMLNVFPQKHSAETRI
ncbi:hypothetical protein [Novosphingobium sp. 11B]